MATHFREAPVDLLFSQAAPPGDFAFSSRPSSQRLEDPPLVLALELAGRGPGDLGRHRVGAAE
jgi:hypothetical protein